MPIYITQKFEDTSVNNTVADAKQIYDEHIQLDANSGLNGTGAYQSEINDYLLRQIDLDADLVKIKSIEAVTKNDKDETGNFLKFEYNTKDEDSGEIVEKTFYSPNINPTQGTISNDDIDDLF